MNYRKLIKAFVFSLILLIALKQPSYTAIEIIAKVNGKPITNYELAQRVNFLATVTNMKLNDSNLKRIENDALQMLIDEKLKLDAAQKIDPNIASRHRSMARDLVNSSFQSNGKTGSEVLRELSLDASAIQQKFVTDLAWSSFIKTKFNEKMRNIEAKADTELNRIRENASQPQIKLSELVLLPEPSRPLKQTLILANEIVNAVSNGADFNAIAQQYSVTGSAQNGGRIGWIFVNQLPKEVNDALFKIEVDEVTKPIQQDGAVYIFQKNGERKNGMADTSQDRVWLARALMPLASNSTKAHRREATARLESDVNALSSCSDLIKLHDRYGSNMKGALDNIVVGTLSPQMRKLVSKLQLGTPSEPLPFSKGIAVFMLCKREKAKIELPSRDDIKRSLIEKIFGSLGERYLMRLRRAAVIERS